MKQRVSFEVKRVRTSTARISVEVDVEDFQDWAGTDGLDPADVARYLWADRNYPANIADELDSAMWRELPAEDEITLRAASRLTKILDAQPGLGAARQGVGHAGIMPDADGVMRDAWGQEWGTHRLETDGLCNYSCTGCDFRYPHVGVGDPDVVAQAKWVEHHVSQ